MAWLDGTTTARRADALEAGIYTGLSVTSAYAEGITTASSNICSDLNTLMSDVSTAGGGVVVLGEGTYASQGTLSVPANVLLMYPGTTGACIIEITGSPTTGNTAVALTGNFATIRGIQFNITGGDYRRGVDFRGATDCRLENCKINVTSTAFGGTFNAVYVANATAPDRAVVVGNEVTGSSTAFNTYKFNGIFANHSAGIRVLDNYVHDVTGTALTRLDWGIYVSGDSQGCLVAGNRVHGLATSGIQVNQDGMVGENFGQRIIGNSVYDCDHIGLAPDGDGIVCHGNIVRQCEILCSVNATTTTATGWSVTGNTFRETVDGQGVSAIDSGLPMVLVNGDYGTFSGNSLDVRGHSLIGVRVDGDYNSVTGNTFGATSPRVAIETASGSTGNVVSGNNIGASDDTTSNRRIILGGTTNVAVGNRMVVPTGSVGMRLTGTQNHAIGNHIVCQATATYGIWVTGTNNRYSENIVSGTVTTRIEAGSATTPSDNDNHITF